MGLRILITEEQIRVRISEIAAQIDADYPDGKLYLIPILKGACFFLADLARAVKRDAYIDFMGISSYGDQKTSSGQVQVTKDLGSQIEGMHVIVVEDIVDTGFTLNYLMGVLRQRHPASLAIAALLDKPSRRIRPVEEVRYVGFQIPDEFVVGYGLDFNEKYRNLGYVAVLGE